MIALVLSLFGILGLAAVSRGGSTNSTSDDTSDIEDSSNPNPQPHTNENDEDTDQNDHDDNGHDHEDSDDDVDHEHEIDPPLTAEEIAAFVEMVRNMSETHVHGSDSSKLTEHMKLLELVPRVDATHIAIGHGDWDDPSNWHNGEVPGDGAKVLIPHGISIDYDHVSDARLFTVRVDGQLEFATDTDSKMVVDTMVVSPTGSLTIGTEANPVEADVVVDIVIANNGAIDTDWDPMLLSRGVISHGKVEIHGAEKDSHEKVIEDPMAGDTSITFAAAPTGWQVGDTIVIAGTEYHGYQYSSSAGEKVFLPPEDEIRTISHIDGNTVHFEEPLVHDHDTPSADLFTSVANYTRNVSIETEGADTAEVYERGHVMFMHSDNVDVRYAEFHELGRTDKSQDLFKAESEGDTSFDSNVAGRYGLHLHRLGVDDLDNPAVVIGNAVYGSPGWGFVHHDSNALLDNNASYNTFGAGFVAETGNETGTWTDNIAIFAKGVDWGGAKGLNDTSTFDVGKSGDGFWFQGRMVDAEDNVAASVNHGFIYFHRGETEEGKKLPFDADVWAVPEALNYDEEAHTSHVPVLSFEDNEAFASRMGLHVIKGNALQGHDIHSVFSDFSAWNVYNGANFQYTSHYVVKDFNIIALEGDGETGISFGKNTFDMSIISPTVEGFDIAIDLYKSYSNNINAESDDHDYILVSPTYIANDVNLANYDSSVDLLLNGVPHEITPYITLDGPLTYKEGSSDPEGRLIDISGTKTDSLSTQELPAGPDDYDLDREDVVSLLEENGYYAADDGKKYLILNIYFSDSLTGDIFKQSELVHINDNVPLGDSGSVYADAKFNGFIAKGDLNDMVDNGTQVVLRADDFELLHTPEEFSNLSGEQFMQSLMVDDEQNAGHMHHNEEEDDMAMA